MVWPEIAYLIVCSDETVGHPMDDYVALDPKACNFPVTTDASVVHQFLEQPFDIRIFDEAHKTVGHQTSGLALENVHVPIKKNFS